MADNTRAGAGTTYRATAEASSSHPQDWGRALQVVVSDLAEQAERDGLGAPESNLLDTDVVIRFVRTEDGVTVTAEVTPPAAHAPATED
jgi:hypothetical protein